MLRQLAVKDVYQDGRWARPLLDGLLWRHFRTPNRFLNLLNPDPMVRNLTVEDCGS
jgi:hypothetical protein